MDALLLVLTAIMFFAVGWAMGRSLPPTEE